MCTHFAWNNLGWPHGRESVRSEPRGVNTEGAGKSRAPSRVQSRTAHEVVLQSHQSTGTVTLQCKVASRTGIDRNFAQRHENLVHFKIQSPNSEL